MRVPDPSLLSSTAASVQQSSKSSSYRPQDGDPSFGDVYKKTAVEKRQDNEHSSASRRKDDSGQNDSSKASSRKDESDADESSKVARDASDKRETSEADDRADAPKSNAEAAEADKKLAAKRSDLQKALSEARSMDDAALEKLAEELGLNAEDLATALEELAKGIEKTTVDAANSQAPTDQLEDGDIAALFQLLIGQKKASDGAKADASDKSSEDSKGNGEDADAAMAADASPSTDDIADLLNVLTNSAQKQDTQVADGDGEAQGSTTFRFERADGKGVPVELQIGGAKDGEALEDGQGSSKVENITVLDSRRYLAPTDVNASNVVSNITGDKTWAAAMKSAPTPNMPALPPEKVITEVNTLKIQMHPVDLGTVTATLRLKGDDLIVSMSVHNAEAYNQLNADKDKIIQSLRSQGFSVDQINIQFSATPDRAVQPSASSQQHQNGQQMSGGSDGNAARQGQQDESRRQQSNGQNAFQTVDDLPSVGSSNTAADNRAGQIYI